MLFSREYFFLSSELFVCFLRYYLQVYLITFLSRCVEHKVYCSAVTSRSLLGRGVTGGLSEGQLNMGK